MNPVFSFFYRVGNVGFWLASAISGLILVIALMLLLQGTGTDENAQSALVAFILAIPVWLLGLAWRYLLCGFRP